MNYWVSPTRKRGRKVSPFEAAEILNARFHYNMVLKALPLYKEWGGGHMDSNPCSWCPCP
jgi:hypothetical protein